MLIALFGLLHAASPAWQPDYAAAAASAQKEGKNLFVFISTEDCRWCRKLEAFTLSDPAVAERLNGAYASVHVTRDRDAYPAHLEAPVVPMCYFLLPDGTVIDFARGFWDTTDFNLILNDVDKRLKKIKETR